MQKYIARLIDRADTVEDGETAVYLAADADARIGRVEALEDALLKIVNGCDDEANESRRIAVKALAVRLPVTENEAL